ncbi:pectin methylesterase, family CE8 [Zostera marina]|uniref:Pectinesterase n=1 Tax=Zostera marina TaxID=29655 RepID=A0A0K9PII7_ZOSMR|nr:pectin methylesterase, family CE8 [Zostera marina]
MDSLINKFFNIFIYLLFLTFFLQFPTVSPDSILTWNGISISKTKGFDEEIGELNILVSKDGTGHSLTVQGAIDLVPNSNSKRVKIFISPGFYREKILVPNNKPYISLIGQKNFVPTVLSWNDRASTRKKSSDNPMGTYNSASVIVESDYFHASYITFENTSPEAPVGVEGLQAVALRVSGNNTVFVDCWILGWQDTLFDHIGNHLFYRCYIRGSIDFIFGSAKSLYEECIMESSARTFGAIAAHQRDDPYEDSGFTFSNCNISGTGKVYLGRAWGNFSRIIYAFCHMDDIIVPKGWSNWDDRERQPYIFFAEYNCTGFGADQSRRVPWIKNLTYNQVKPFLGKSSQIDDQNKNTTHKSKDTKKDIPKGTSNILVNKLRSIIYIWTAVFYIFFIF